MEEFYRDDEYVFFSTKDETMEDEFILAAVFIEDISIEEQLEAYEFVQSYDDEAEQFDVYDFELLDTNAKRFEVSEVIEGVSWNNITVLLPVNTDLIGLTFSFKTEEPLYEECVSAILSSMSWGE